MSLISVIVPVYMVEPYLDRCVQSIINQTYTDLEIILVDDGSEDNCPSMCDHWAQIDNRVKVIHKKNGGLSDARNAGMAIAKGEYIAFIDSDDWVDKSFIYYLYEGIQNTGADLAACDVCEAKSEESILEIIEEPKITKHSSFDAIYDLTKGTRFRAVAWNKLYKSSILNSESYPLKRFHEDEFLTYRIYDKCKVLAYVDAPLYYYYQRGGSIMSTRSDKHIDILEAYLERQSFFKKKYPQLYLEDKLLFCKACINLYSENYENSFSAKKRIKEYRAKVHFTIEELLKFRLKQQIYIVGSLPLVIPFTSVIKKRKR